MAKSPKASALIDTQVVYCGDNLEQLRQLPEAYVDLIYIDAPFAPSALLNLRMGFFATRSVAYFEW